MIHNVKTQTHTHKDNRDESKNTHRIAQEERIQVGKWKNAKVTDLIRRWAQNMAAG